MDLSDAIAGSLTQQAMRERTGITVEPVIWAGVIVYGVFQDGKCTHLRRTEDRAYAVADELAGELIDAGDLES